MMFCLCRRPFPAGDRVTFNGKDCLCQCCIQPMSPPPKDISASSSESQHAFALCPCALYSKVLFFQLSCNLLRYPLPVPHDSPLLRKAEAAQNSEPEFLEILFVFLHFGVHPLSRDLLIASAVLSGFKSKSDPAI